jgi:nucleoside-diphosphate-sugar epimerase
VCVRVLPGIKDANSSRSILLEKEYTIRTILITGGNGFLGRHLVMALQERGDRVRVLALPTEDTAWLEKHGVEIFRGNICDAHMLEMPLSGVDGVFHLAAMIGAWRSMQDYYSVNVAGTENVCRMALEAGVQRLIHISSAMVYNMSIGYPVTENDPVMPLDEPYSLTKAQGDLLVQQMIKKDHLPAVIIRAATLFGPGDLLNFGRIADRLRAGKGVIVGSGENAIPLVYVTDMVQGLLLAMDQPCAEGQIYNIGNDQPLTQGLFLSSIAHEIEVAPPRLHVPYYPLYAAAYAAERIAVLSNNRIPPFLTRHGVKLYGANNRLSIAKARRELGYSPQVSIREGIHITADWYLRQDTWTLEKAVVSVSESR